MLLKQKKAIVTCSKNISYFRLSCSDFSRNFMICLFSDFSAIDFGVILIERTCSGKVVQLPKLNNHFGVFKLLSNEVYSNYISPAGLFLSNVLYY